MNNAGNHTKVIRTTPRRYCHPVSAPFRLRFQFVSGEGTSGGNAHRTPASHDFWTSWSLTAAVPVERRQ